LWKGRGKLSNVFKGRRSQSFAEGSLLHLWDVPGEDESREEGCTPGEFYLFFHQVGTNSPTKRKRESTQKIFKKGKSSFKKK